MPPVTTGPDRAALLSRVGLAPGDEPGVSRMVSDENYYGLLETIAKRIDAAAGFPMQVGGSMRADDYGAFGLAWKTGPTLRGALQRAARCARILTSVAAFEVQDNAQGVLFHCIVKSALFGLATVERGHFGRCCFHHA